MAQQTINVGTAPNDGTGTPLRTAFQYTNSNFSELYTAVGPSGNNIVVPGNATITGDLTVDTSTLKVDSANNRVGIGTASPESNLDVRGLIAVRGTPTFPTTGVGLEAYYSISNTTTYLQSYDRSGGAFANLSYNALAHIFQTNGATAMTLNSTGLGIGGSVTNKLTVTVTPPTSNSDGLVINGPSSRQIIAGITGATYSYAGVGANQNLIYGGNAQLNILGDNQNVRIATSAANYLLLDTAGQVGIGVTPSAWGAGYKALQLGDGLSLMGSTINGTIAANAWFDGTNWKYISANSSAQYYCSYFGNGSHVWTTSTGVPSAGGTVSYNQAMTLDASGNLLVGDTAQVAAEKLQVNQTVTNAWAVTMRSVTRGWLNRQSDANGGYAAYFEVGSSNTNVGSIATTSSGTSFVTTSDYRLKESVQPLVGGLARVSALKPSIYKWKIDGSNGEGFLAHELAEVVPFAVTGEKDATNADGSIKPQGVDLSKVVPILVAAIQELAAEVNALKTA